jgi:hypothetical protein
MARAIAGTDEITNRTMRRRDLTSEEKRLCRHWAREGLTYPEIAKRLNWTLTVESLTKKLKAINIYTYYADRNRRPDFS